MSGGTEVKIPRSAYAAAHAVARNTEATDLALEAAAPLIVAVELKRLLNTRAITRTGQFGYQDFVDQIVARVDELEVLGGAQ